MAEQGDPSNITTNGMDSSEPNRTIRTKIDNVVKTIDDACNRLAVVSSTASQDKKITIDSIRNCLLAHKNQLILACNENVGNIYETFQNVVRAISAEIETAFIEIQTAGGDHILQL